MARLFVGSDHAAVSLRRDLLAALRAEGHEILGEFGPAAEDQRCDYPDVAIEVSQRILANPGALGLLVCGSGQGMAMTANRFAGIRAAVCADVYSAKVARAHNDANVLCLGARVLGLGHATLILTEFLASAFEGGRHAARVAKMDAAGS